MMIALANTIYKLYTNTMTALHTIYKEQQIILQFSQEGFRPQENTFTQIQMIIASVEDTRLTNKDIYLTYIDYHNAFNFINHVRLLAIMEHLRFPPDVVDIAINIYTHSTIAFT